jgi:hypothetical protein
MTKCLLTKCFLCERSAAYTRTYTKETRGRVVIVNLCYGCYDTVKEGGRHK